MSREAHVPFCERLEVKSLRPTHRTEVGAEYVGIFHGLIATCRLHDVDPYTYFVDVLQRVATHPAKDIDMLIPRLWKQHFASNPMRSDVDRIGHSVR